MIARFNRVVTAALYQLTLTVAMVLLPIAVATRRLGITVPMHRLLKRVRSLHRRNAANR